MQTRRAVEGSRKVWRSNKFDGGEEGGGECTVQGSLTMAGATFLAVSQAVQELAIANALAKTVSTNASQVVVLQQQEERADAAEARALPVGLDDAARRPRRRPRPVLGRCRWGGGERQRRWHWPR